MIAPRHGFPRCFVPRAATRVLPALALTLAGAAFFAGRQAAKEEPAPFDVRATCTVVNTADSGAGSLREAINCANASPGLDTITFAIPGSAVQTIALVSALPDITGPVLIDGYTQPGSTPNTNTESSGLNTILRIAVTGGGSSPASPWQMRLTGSGITIRGLVINGGTGRNGIRIIGPGGNKIEGCFIGTNPSGTATSATEANNNGILINDSPNNVIGGTEPAARNLISGNFADGIQIFGTSSTGNRVEGNLIGTTASGTTGLRNTGNGVSVGGSNNVVGGSVPGSRNTISGNGFTPTNPPAPNFDGVRIGFNASNNRIEGNFIGTNVSGTAAIPNSVYGVNIDTGSNGSGNVVGGTGTGSGNLISGNLSHGLRIIGGGGNRAERNQIGTNAAGTAALPNGGSGVFIFFSSNNTIGAANLGAGNLISGNTASGVRIEGTSSGLGSTGNVVQGNIIGTNFGGSAAIPNNKGVVLRDAVNNTIGGLAATAGAAPGNLISGNTGVGIELSSSVVAGQPPDDSDQTQRPDGGGPNDPTSQNTIRGNLIGTNAAGSAALPNTGAGIVVFDSRNNTFGGSAAGAGNVISGNTGNGVYVTGIAAANNIFSGNLIGRNAANTGPLGNTGHGMYFIGSGPNTIGGGFNPNNANVIAHNTLDGVAVVFFQGASFKKGIISNSIFSNGGLGIDLGDDGVTPNDPGDGDTGPNALQNYPVLTSAVASGGNTTITGTLNSTPNTSFYVEFFAGAAADPTGFGEGQTYLGAVSNVTTNAAGNAAINAVLTGTPPAGQTFITATATDNAELANTSEFSQAIVLQGGATPTPTPGSISGVVTYGTTPAGQAAKFVPGVVLNADGSPPSSATTNAAGAYMLSGLGSGPYTVTPSKSGDVNGSISGLDAARVAQHVAGLITLTPNQQLAGDATNNGGLSGLDAARIAQFAAGLANPGIAGQWKFIPPSRSYASGSGDKTGQNYEAILMGDVTGNWSPAAARGVTDKGHESDYPLTNHGDERNSMDLDRDRPDAIEVALPGKVQAAPGAEVAIPLWIGDTSVRGILAYDITVRFDPDVLTPSEVAADLEGTLSEGWTVVHNTHVPGRIRITAFGISPLAGNGALLNLRFDAAEATGRSTRLWIVTLQLNEGEVPSKASDGKLTVTDTGSGIEQNGANRRAASERSTRDFHLDRAFGLIPIFHFR
jgi:hypothetical protein